MHIVNVDFDVSIDEFLFVLCKYLFFFFFHRPAFHWTRFETILSVPAFLKQNWSFRTKRTNERTWAMWFVICLLFWICFTYFQNLNYNLSEFPIVFRTKKRHWHDYWYVVSLLNENHIQIYTLNGILWARISVTLSLSPSKVQLGTI